MGQRKGGFFEMEIHPSPSLFSHSPFGLSSSFPPSPRPADLGLPGLRTGCNTKPGDKGSKKEKRPFGPFSIATLYTTTCQPRSTRIQIERERESPDSVGAVAGLTSYEIRDRPAMLRPMFNWCEQRKTSRSNLGIGERERENRNFSPTPK